MTMTERQRIGEIVEAAIGSREYTALHVSEVQAGAETLYDALKDDPNIAPEFLDLLCMVARFEVRL